MKRSKQRQRHEPMMREIDARAMVQAIIEAVGHEVSIDDAAWDRATGSRIRMARWKGSRTFWLYDPVPDTAPSATP